jgi:hypothetical protein
VPLFGRRLGQWWKVKIECSTQSWDNERKLVLNVQELGIVYPAASRMLSKFLLDVPGVLVLCVWVNVKGLVSAVNAKRGWADKCSWIAQHGAGQ